MTPEEYQSALDAVEAGLTDSDPNVVMSWIRPGLGKLHSSGMKPTREQAVRGWNTSYNSEKYEEQWNVAAAWIAREDYSPTIEEINAGLSHQSTTIKQAWGMRTDYIPNDVHIMNGLADQNVGTMYLWMDREDIKLNKEHIDFLLRNFSASEKDMIKNPANWESAVIECFIARDLQLESIQIEKILCSAYYKYNQDIGPVSDFIREQIAGVATAARHDIQEQKRPRRISI